jgi:hypothetical protein
MEHVETVSGLEKCKIYLNIILFCKRLVTAHACITSSLLLVLGVLRMNIRSFYRSLYRFSFLQVWKKLV